MEISLFPPILPFSTDVFLQSLPVSLCFVANVACSFFGLQLVSVPMFLCLRRTVTAFVMVTQFLMFSQRPSQMTLVGVSLLVVGALVAGHDALEGNVTGLVFTFLNNVLTTLSLLLTKRFSDNTKAEGLAIVWFNALVAVPASLLAANALGEFEELVHFERLYEPLFQLSLLTSMCGGAVITYAVALCTTINSPMATAVTGNSKDIVTTVIGAAVFSGFNATLSSVLGLLLSFAGAATYSWGKLRGSFSSSTPVGSGSGSTAPYASPVTPKAPRDAAPLPATPVGGSPTYMVETSNTSPPPPSSRVTTPDHEHLTRRRGGDAAV